MNTKKLYSSWLLGLATLLLLAGCYKEDTNNLLSRQYVLVGSLKDLEHKVDSINNAIGNLNILINGLQNKEPVTNLVYDEKDGVRVGATLTLGTKTIYIPFGKDGNSPKVTIGDNGNWFIDGKDTNKPARGEKPEVTIGKNGNWFVDNEDTGKPSQGAPGHSPTVTIGANGNWFIDGKDTNKPARGEKPEVTIGKNGNWFVDNEDTGKPSQGAPGHSPTVTIGENGNWLIDGKDTNKKAIGTDAKTPVVGIKQDPDNPKDEHFYWTIKYGDEQPTFILDQNGEKVIANGLDGKNGSNSPITGITKSKDGQTVTITTTLPGLETIVLPLHKDQFFYIQPAENGDKYTEPTNTLMFATAQEALPVPFTHSDDLVEFYAEVPDDWKATLDPATKRYTVQAPSVENVSKAAHQGTARFVGITKTGDTYTRYLNLELTPRYYFNLFFTHPDRIPTEVASSPNNLLSIQGLTAPDMTQIIGYQEVNKKEFLQVRVLKDETNKDTLQKYITTSPSYVFDKNPLDKKHNVTISNILYDTDAVDFLVNNNDPYNPGSYMISTQKEYPERALNNARFIGLVPRNMYMAYHTLQASEKSEVINLRYRMSTVQWNLNVLDPAKLLKLPEGEAFDPDKLKLYVRVPQGMFADKNETRYKDKIGDQHTYALVTKDDNVYTYDANEKLFKASFCTFPPSWNNYVRIWLEYEKADGSIVKDQVYSTAPLELPTGGDSFTYYIGGISHYSPNGTTTKDELAHWRNRLGSTMYVPAHKNFIPSPYNPW